MKVWLVRLLFLSSSLVFTIFISEKILKLTGRFPSTEIHSVSYKDFKRIPGPWEPNQDLVSLSIPELPHHITTTKLGFRSVHPDKLSKKKKILMIGDSFTFGSYVDDQDTLPSQLQKHLGYSKYAVINAGVGGSTITDQIKFLSDAMDVNPSIVILTFSENDLDDLYTKPGLYEQLSNNRKLKRGFTGAVYNQIRDTCLFNLALRAKAYFNNSQSVEARELAEGEDSESANMQKMIEYLINLKRLKRDLDEIEIKLIFLGFPSHLNIFDGEKSQFSAVAKAMGYKRTLNLFDVLKNSGLSREELYLMPYDGHPTAEAYKIAAQAVKEQFFD